jgi:hypothetical protein
MDEVGKCDLRVKRQLSVFDRDWKYLEIIDSILCVLTRN